MESKSKSLPFVVLVERPDVIYTRSIKDTPTNATSPPGSNTDRVSHLVIIENQFPLAAQVSMQTGMGERY